MKQIGNNLNIMRGIGLDKAVTQFEQWYIWWALEKNDFNQTKTAEELGIHRNSLVNRIDEWGWRGRIDNRDHGGHS